jgi:thiamine biosynthesis lipoprotein
MPSPRSLGVLSSLLALAGCARPEQRFEFSRVSMGVPCRVVLYAQNGGAAEAAASLAFHRVAALEAAMSDYRPQSELSRLSAGAGGPPVHVSDDLLAVLREARAVSNASGGAFDITAGPPVALWRLARATHALPSPEQRDEAGKLVGAELIVFDEPSHTVRLLRRGMKLDLGGIAKGYAAQRAVETLRAAGRRRALVSLSGDIAAGDPPPGARGWLVAIQSGTADPPLGSLILANASVSTSGSSEQFVEIAGVRYSHIIDPRTGLGLTHQLTVTTVSRNGARADALATAACILGPEQGPALIRRSPATGAIFQSPSGLTITDPAGLLRWARPPPR